MAKKPTGWKAQPFAPSPSRKRTDVNEHTTNTKPKPSTRKSWWTSADPQGFTKRAEQEIKS